MGYTQFVTRSKYRWCWSCGATRPPKSWGAPWYLQRAHLGHGSGSMYRVEDVRAVVILCPLCHELHCGLKEKVVNGATYQTLSNANMLWLKKAMDPDNYDREFIRRYWTGRPPDPEPLPMYFEVSYIALRGHRPHFDVTKDE